MTMGLVCPGCTSTIFTPFAQKGEFRYLRCRGCGLLAIDPMPSEEQIASHYGRKFQSGNYALARTFANEYLAVYRQYGSWMAKFADLKRACTLDIGCFTGDLMGILLNEAGANAYGVELQEEAAALAEARFPGRVFRHNIDHKSDFLADGSFDAISAMGVIEHVQLPGSLLSRSRRLLKDGGWLFLQTPNASSVAARLSGAHWPPLAPIEHLFLFSERGIAGALSQSGFRVREGASPRQALPVAYVCEMLRHFGPEWRRVFEASIRRPASPGAALARAFLRRRDARRSPGDSRHVDRPRTVCFATISLVARLPRFK